MSHRKLKVYHYPACGTCRAALKQLAAQGREVETTHLFESPPSVEELRELVGRSGLPLQKWFNTSGEAYREMGLKDKLKTMSDDEKLALLASNGRLIKRPVVTDGERVTVGYREEEYAKTWK